SRAPPQPGVLLMRRTLAISWLLLLVAVPALADWPASGKFVLLTTDSFRLTARAWIDDLPNGDLLVRGVGVGGNNFGYDVQRISAFGDVLATWPARGRSFGTMGKAIRFYEQGATVDESGSMWMIGQAALPYPFVSTLGAHKVDVNGVLSPGGNPWAIEASQDFA